MYDRFNRQINYLRISVTDRCNLRCRYCMPEHGVPMLPHHEILSFEEIVEIVNVGVNMGINKVRITGGDPLVRKNIEELIYLLSQIDGIRDLSMTTNAILLDKYAKILAEAGLHRVNISLDTVDPVKYSYITRGGDIDKVFRGIEAARQAGLLPIKINCVVERSSAEPDAQAVKKFCIQHDLEVRFIHQMDLKNGSFSVVEGGDGGNCRKCHRLRLTANGKLKPCLFNDLEYDVRELGAEQAIKKAVENKPECGTMNNLNKFHNIGG
ncbi:MAG: radical SAM protein [Bacteroidales bacterium]|nr:radical SAM protein [Bacteroidales bacterium]